MVRGGLPPRRFITGLRLRRKGLSRVNSTSSQALTRRRRVLVLIVMCAALAAVVSAVSSLNVALPDIARKLDASSSDLQWIVDAYAMVFAGLLLLSGSIGDRLGRRPVLLAGLVVFAGAAAAATFVESPGSLILARSVMGVGAAAIMPSTLAIITNVFPDDERDRAVAIWAGVAGGSALLGLLVSGLLLEWFSWPSVFAFSSVLGIGALAVSVIVAPNSTADETGLDLVGGLGSVLALSTLVYGIIEAPERGWTDALTLTSLLGAAVLIAAFVLWELRVEHPLLDPRLFRLRGFAAGTVSMTVQFFTFFGFVFVMLQYLQFVLDYSPLVAGLALSPMAVAMVGLSPQVPRFVNKWGAGPVGALGLAAMAGGFATLASLSTGSGYWHILAGLIPLGVGLALATTPATTAIVSSLPASKQGVASAVNDAAREVGGALGIAVLGSVLSDQYRSAIASAAQGLSPEIAARASEGLPAALAIGKQLGPGGATFVADAQMGFVDGLGLAMYVAAGCALAAAVFVLIRAPRKTETAAEPRTQ